MTEDVQANLLGSIPTGEEIRDPKEGDHPNARLADVDIVEQSNGHSLQLIYTDLVATDGRPFDQKERVSLPTSNSEDFIHRIFLALCHDLEIVPRTFKSRVFVDTEDDRERVRAAFATKLGNTIPLRIQSDKQGYLRSRIIRFKKKG